MYILLMACNIIIQLNVESWCEKKCGRSCSKGLTVSTLKSFRESFWVGDATTAIEKRRSIFCALKTAQERYLCMASAEAVNPNDFSDELCFKVDGKIVCQKYFANLVGMADRNGFKNKLWLSEVSILKNKNGSTRRPKARHKD